ncbi:MAG TPA: ester cyclase [Gemmatimonadaceae bacterium]|nr:ester cyclase [Gemmatimonadaceae bacterium]
MSVPRSDPIPSTPTRAGLSAMPATTTGAARLVLELYAIYNDRAFDRGAAMVAPDFELQAMPTGELFRGTDGYRAFVGIWAAAFPDSRVDIRTVVAEGDSVCVEFVGRGTHDGPFRTPGGTIPPTGRAVEIPFLDLWRVRDGVVQGGRTYFDIGTIMRQLGLLT